MNLENEQPIEKINNLIKRTICLFKGHYTGKHYLDENYGFGGFMVSSNKSKKIKWYCLRCGELVKKRRILITQ